MILDKGRIKLKITASSISASFKGRKRVKANRVWGFNTLRKIATRIIQKMQ
jgi:hypothetical protein